MPDDVFIQRLDLLLDAINRICHLSLLFFLIEEHEMSDLEFSGFNSLLYLVHLAFTPVFLFIILGFDLLEFFFLFLALLVSFLFLLDEEQILHLEFLEYFVHLVWVADRDIAYV